MKFAYQTQTNQYVMTNRILVCVEHGFVVNKIHTSITEIVHKKVLCYM